MNSNGNAVIEPVAGTVAAGVRLLLAVAGHVVGALELVVSQS